MQIRHDAVYLGSAWQSPWATAALAGLGAGLARALIAQDLAWTQQRPVMRLEWVVCGLHCGAFALGALRQPRAPKSHASPPLRRRAPARDQRRLCAATAFVWAPVVLGVLEGLPASRSAHTVLQASGHLASLLGDAGVLGWLLGRLGMLDDAAQVEASEAPRQRRSPAARRPVAPPHPVGAAAPNSDAAAGAADRAVGASPHHGNDAAAVTPSAGDAAVAAADGAARPTMQRGVGAVAVADGGRQAASPSTQQRVVDLVDVLAAEAKELEAAGTHHCAAVSRLLRPLGQLASVAVGEVDRALDSLAPCPASRRAAHNIRQRIARRPGGLATACNSAAARHLLGTLTGNADL